MLQFVSYLAFSVKQLRGASRINKTSRILFNLRRAKEPPTEEPKEELMKMRAPKKLAALGGLGPLEAVAEGPAPKDAAAAPSGFDDEAAAAKEAKGGLAMEFDMGGGRKKAAPKGLADRLSKGRPASAARKPSVS